jgi:hypothetical protein
LLYFILVKYDKSVISGFRRYADDILAHLGYYTASSGKSFIDVSGQSIGPIFKGQESKKKRKGSLDVTKIGLHIQVYSWTS